MGVISGRFPPKLGIFTGLRNPTAGVPGRASGAAERGAAAAAAAADAGRIGAAGDAGGTRQGAGGGAVRSRAEPAAR